MTLKKSKEFWKIEAAGNDFILYFRPPVRGKKFRDEVIEFARLHTGVGADGVIYAWHQRNTWNWAFFNADGSETMLCGNATRALALWITKYGNQLVRKRPAKLIEWVGKLGRFSARRRKKNGDFEVTWPAQNAASTKVPDELMEVVCQLNELGLAGAYLYDVGVPHLVLLGHEVWNASDRMTSNLVFRSHPALGPAGANITWIEMLTRQAITYERGVERETLACGSGAMAGFLAVEQFKAERNEKITQAKLEFPGGTLEVRRETDGRLWLGGPARVVYRGERSDC